MKKWLCLLCLLSMPLAVHAAPQSWMKKDNSKELGLYVIEMSNGCPFSKRDVQRRIEGEFVRSGIKPIEDINLALTVKYHCMVLQTNSRKTGNTVFADVRFSGVNPENRALIIYELPDYASFSTGGTDAGSHSFHINSIVDNVNQALTDYLLANME